MDFCYRIENRRVPDFLEMIRRREHLDLELAGDEEFGKVWQGWLSGEGCAGEWLEYALDSDRPLLWMAATLMASEEAIEAMRPEFEDMAAEALSAAEEEGFCWDPVLDACAYREILTDEECVRILATNRSILEEELREAVRAFEAPVIQCAVAQWIERPDAEVLSRMSDARAWTELLERGLITDGLVDATERLIVNRAQACESGQEFVRMTGALESVSRFRGELRPETCAELLVAYRRGLGTSGIQLMMRRPDLPEAFFRELWQMASEEREAMARLLLGDPRVPVDVVTAIVREGGSPRIWRALEGQPLHLLHLEVREEVIRRSRSRELLTEVVRWTPPEEEHLVVPEIAKSDPELILAGMDTGEFKLERPLPKSLEVRLINGGDPAAQALAEKLGSHQDEEASSEGVGPEPFDES